ncbi:class I SAM-dependent methyltransferase [Actinomadura viridis]|uniref:SAM-dependent methyltransferase n=1 Tax=Actinomadura viridis TaxID=58110 RepID=A0A931DHD9_9ACTN|nr:class I SAM-dependent methyltransferase [Actinomadura viridis]MBG6086955.1 SAM-dependent methyltransferase [Actinomadura viridis]
MNGSSDHLAGARQDHWDTVYSDRGERRVSWYQADPRLSVELIEEAAGEGRDGAVIDVGGGASLLASRLVDEGFRDVTVLDVSEVALETARRAASRRPGGERITWVHADLLSWRPPRRYAIWHDRAVFHFLTERADRAAYLAVLRAALVPRGAIVLAAFAPEGPGHCSGLPVARYDAGGLAAELTGAFGDDVTLTARRTERHVTPAGAVQPFTWISARLG